uniref:Molybdenum cofactor sulfurase n=1 Tax=Lygus hesperus TaxID=30085 RepID=A0A0A9YGS3_LYGHE
MKSSPRRVSTNSNGGAEQSTSDDPRTAFTELFTQKKELLIWWANHCERRRNFAEALQFYNAGEDVFNVVRMLCTCVVPAKIDQALELVNHEIKRVRSEYEQRHTKATAVVPDYAISTTRGNAKGVNNKGKEQTGIEDAPDYVGAAFFIGQYYEQTHEL